MDAVSGNQVKPGPMDKRGAHRGHRKVLRQHLRQAEQILFVGAVAVQQDQKRLAGPLLLRLGP